MLLHRLRHSAGPCSQSHVAQPVARCSPRKAETGNRSPVSPLYIALLLDLHPLGGRRAIIKAHPTTPHHPRPYSKSISLGKMESPSLYASCKTVICPFRGKPLKGCGEFSMRASIQMPCYKQDNRNHLKVKFTNRR